jgi:beta-1,4-mannosyltransferase
LLAGVDAHNAGIKNEVVVLYDKPSSVFRRLSKLEKLMFMARLDWSGGELVVSDTPLASTPFTITVGGDVREANDRPALVCSSTSWTPDEDFSILIDALRIYDSKAKRKLYVVITGKGPLKAQYMHEIDSMQMSNVVVKSVWLAQEDYPTLIGCCDLGVSLHTSSSGLDLPMKVVGMFSSNQICLALGSLFVRLDLNGM